ncbi:MAG: S9 family peptidase [Bacteroidales bacterium 36-12]|nr:MAG: S9 family peptidase [Bacteroidales bacterium 36-12]
MKKTVFILISLLAFISINADNLLFDITDGKYKSDTGFSPKSMKDGEHYTLMTDNQTIVKYSYKTGEAIDTLLSINKVKIKLIDSFSGYIMSPSESKILVYTNVEKRYRRSYTADYYIYDIKYKEFDPLSAKSPQESPVFSDDDRYIAFAHNRNLYMKKVEFKTDIQITKDGEEGKISNGISDWLYEEEFGKTYSYTWSPDSKLLAYVKFNEKNIKKFSFQTFLNKEDRSALLYPEATTFKYPKAGENNTLTTVCIYDDFNKTTRTIELNNDSNSYIPKILWTSTSDQLAVMQLNREQNTLNMYLVNPKTGISKLISRETSKQYIDPMCYESIIFRNDKNGFYKISDKDGFRHIYQYKNDGTISRQVTKGNWDITAFYGVDEKKNLVYFQSSKFSPMQRNIFSVDAKGKETCLAPEVGNNAAYFSSNYSYFTHTFSSFSQPAKISIRNNNGTLLRNIEDNQKILTKFNNLNLNQKEIFSFNTSDNINLNGWMLKPVNFNPDNKYPVVMIQYSGPGSQSVVNEWNVGWEYYLSSKGYLVVCVDGRGTGQRGAEFMKCTYKQLGVLEANDQVEAAKYLGKLSFVDKDRISIWGWSYGGTVTLMAMSTGEKIFKAGIAVAPVTDWRFYNSAYTERFMLTPEQNADGYNNASALRKANLLEGRLLLIHGSADDNVHYSNTLVYADKLVEEGKQFEMQIYTDKNHSILGTQTRRHLYTRMFEFLEGVR